MQHSQVAPSAVRSVVVIAVSAGGVGPLMDLVRGLPGDLDAAVVVVQHRSSTHPSRMAELLRHRSSLQIDEAVDGDRLGPGRLLMAPAGHHLLLDRRGTVALVDSSKVNYVRPSADLLFESAAEHYASRVLAVVMSGSGLDGAGGVRAVKRSGGRVLVQDPASAQFPSMPQASIETGCADELLAPGDLAAAVATWSRRPAVAGG